MELVRIFQLSVSGGIEGRADVVFSIFGAVIHECFGDMLILIVMLISSSGYKIDSLPRKHLIEIRAQQ